ncbi:MAG: hypothetical protein ACRCU3_06015 [Eubacteriaceae bacterium]
MLKTEKGLNKAFSIAKIVLVISPLLTIVYLNMGFFSVGSSLDVMLKENPVLTIGFLSAMVQPFVAYLLSYLWRKYQEGNVEMVILNLLILFLGEALLGSVLGMVAMLLLIFGIYQVVSFSLKDYFKYSKRSLILKSISGSLMVLPIASLCAFAMMQVK